MNVKGVLKDTNVVTRVNRKLNISYKGQQKDKY